MKKLGKSLLIFILARIINLVYSPFLIKFKHYHTRKKAIRHFVEESVLHSKLSPTELTMKSLQYLRMFKRLNMLLLLSGVFVNDIEIFYKTLGDAKITGLDILEENMNKSVIGISYHIGPFSIMPVLLALRGYNTNLLVRSDTMEKQTRVSIEKINESMALLARQNNLGRVRFIDSLEPLSLILIRKCLKEGEMLMIYPDTAKESSVSSIPVSFFNTKIAGHIGVAKLCRFTRATIIPFSIRWDEENKIEMNIDEPMDINPDGTDEEIINSIYGPFEKKVASYPEQWINIENYKKFKY